MGLTKYQTRHNHHTRDIKPIGECIACDHSRLEQKLKTTEEKLKVAEKEAKQWEELANEWMDSYQDLKDQYEPEIITEMASYISEQIKEQKGK